MKKLLLSAVLMMTVSVGVAQAHPICAVSVVGTESAATLPLFAAGALIAPAAITYAIAENVDPWHPLACALFGDDGRVGTDKDSACKH
jgi:hypothetical protein